MKLNKKQKQNIISIFLAALIIAILLGLVSTFLGQFYIIPYVYVDLYSFISIAGYGILFIIFADIITSKR